MDTENARRRFSEVKEQLTGKARDVSQVTDRFVHDNAWTTLAAAAIIGCMIGYFLRPRD